MELIKAVLVLADIGGYTRFIKMHGTSLVHAERIITDLLESVINESEFPLTLNKLEGDAALFYAGAGVQESGRRVGCLRATNKTAETQRPRRPQRTKWTDR